MRDRPLIPSSHAPDGCGASVANRSAGDVACRCSRLVATIARVSLRNTSQEIRDGDAETATDFWDSRPPGAAWA
jgi:hypothetical protein